MTNYKRVAQSILVVASLWLGVAAANAQAFDVPLTNQFVAMYGSTTSTTVPVDAWTIINFNSMEADTNSTVTTGAGWYFKSPDVAYVQIQVCVKFGAVTPSAGGYDSLAIFKNGSYIKTLTFDYQWAALGYPIIPTLNGSTLIRCQKDDIIDVRVWHHGPSSATTSSIYQESWITISRVR